MNIIYARQPIDKTKLTSGSVMLCGPTPRTADVLSWRPEAIRRFRELGYGGTLLVPENESGICQGDYIEQVEWEEEALTRANCIMFWIPRKMDTMPGFTTNVEFGTWMRSGRVVLGCPPEAEKVKYLQYYARKLNIPSLTDLDDTIQAAIKMDVRNTIKQPDVNKYGKCPDCGLIMYTGESHKYLCGRV